MESIHPSEYHQSYQKEEYQRTFLHMISQARNNRVLLFEEILVIPSSLCVCSN